MKEANVWAWFNDSRPNWLAAERFEVLSPPGLSDVFWTDKRTSISGWLELKYCAPDNKELRAGRIPKLRPDQPMFMRRQTVNGVPCGILLRVGDEKWMFWLAQPDRDWVENIRGRSAISNVDVSWTFQPEVSEVMAALGCRCEP